MKKVLILGSLGYVGNVLNKFLKSNNYYSKTIDSYFFGDRYLPINNDELNNEICIKDIRKIKSKDLVGYKKIIILAALSNDPLGRLNKGLTNEINHKSIVKIAKMCKKLDYERLVFASSCSVYGYPDNKKDIIDENYRVNPLTEYAKSKIDSEKSLSKLATNKFKIVCLRFGTACGVSNMIRLDLVLNDMVFNAVSSNEIIIKSDGEPWRPLIDVEDMAKIMIKFLEIKKIKDYDYYNVGSSLCNYKVIELAQKIKKFLPNITIKILNENPNDKRSYKVNFNKINNNLNNFKFKKIEKTIKELINFFINYNITDKSFIKSSKFIRLERINNLIKSKKISNDLFWN